ncbi:hypothetical protein NL676_009304 [Syzygium grande]|nr:hypothetical protein NL676_009304 [Syzygium grande]
MGTGPLVRPGSRTGVYGRRPAIPSKTPQSAPQMCLKTKEICVFPKTCKIINAFKPASADREGAASARDSVVTRAYGSQKVAVMGLTPNVSNCTSLINGIGKKGSIKQGFELREEMVRTGWKPNVYAHTALIGGLCKKGWSDEAFGLSSLSLSALKQLGSKPIRWVKVKSYEEQMTEEEFEKMCQPSAPLPLPASSPSIQPSPVNLKNEAAQPAKRGRGRPKGVAANTSPMVTVVLAPTEDVKLHGDSQGALSSHPASSCHDQSPGSTPSKTDVTDMPHAVGGFAPTSEPTPFPLTVGRQTIPGTHSALIEERTRMDCSKLSGSTMMQGKKKGCCGSHSS